jgi:gluconate 2-dehydrogenase gamma chain
MALVETNPARAYERKQENTMTQWSRRELLKTAAGAAAVSGVAEQSASGSAADGAKKTARPEPPKYIFLNPAEAAFIEAAVERLIPADELGPGALQAGVALYIDKQLGGAWGNGERLCRSGPWRVGTPSQGYQLPFTPAELFRNALRALRSAAGPQFAHRSVESQDAFLRELESSERELGGVPAKIFFESLLAMTVEGYFSDPVYGGNTDMAAWRMIGFPGAYAEYYHLIDQHGISFKRDPMSLGQNGRGHVHLEPNIPAQLPHEKV